MRFFIGAASGNAKGLRGAAPHARKRRQDSARTPRGETGVQRIMGRGRVFGSVKGGVLIVAVLALTLAGCGRRGALDTPASVDPAMPGGVIGQPQAVQPSDRDDRRFILDSII
ncbi:LPS translocon maturation chaperone LptM [Stappia sp.]|uniref:LPS translocon maturation chaperone LptM n=1 Tax=Stappia sp. TaxID=1870903 RepID=UPI003C7BE791|eukprot:jgi/Tetstr1/444742/TSEL_032590.t1